MINHAIEISINKIMFVPKQLAPCGTGTERNTHIKDTGSDHFFPFFIKHNLDALDGLTDDVGSNVIQSYSRMKLDDNGKNTWLNLRIDPI